MRIVFIATVLAATVPLLDGATPTVVVRDRLDNFGKISGGVRATKVETEIRGTGQLTESARRPLVSADAAARLSPGTSVEPTAAVAPAEMLLPGVFAPRALVGARRPLVLGPGARASVDWTEVSDCSVEGRSAPVTLPSGSYRNLIVRDATVVLGAASRAEESARYEFSSLVVGSGGRVELSGPVTLVCGGLDLAGSLGEASNPGRLDLRVSRGTVILRERARLFGEILAPESLVTLEAGARVVGLVVAARLGLAAGSEIESPSVDRIAGFAGSYLAVQEGAAIARARLVHHFGVSTAFVDDIPQVVLNETPVPGDPAAQHRAKEAIFEACAAVFAQSRFPRASILASTTAPARERAARTDLKLSVTAAQFEHLARSLSGRTELAAAIEAIRGNPLLVNLFALEVTRSVR